MEPISLTEREGKYGIQLNYTLSLPFTLTENTYLCGGAVKDLLNGETPNDYDIFGFSVSALERFENNLDSKTWHRIHNSPEVVSYKNDKGEKIQIIYRKDRQGTILEVLDDFPFTINQYGYTRDKKLYISIQGLSDEVNKVLRINNVRRFNVINCIDRISKYSRRGYKLHTPSVKKLINTFLESNEEELLDELHIYVRNGGY